MSKKRDEYIIIKLDGKYVVRKYHGHEAQAEGHIWLNFPDPIVTERFTWTSTLWFLIPKEMTKETRKTVPFLPRKDKE